MVRKQLSNLPLLVLLLTGTIGVQPLRAQSITAAADGTGTVVTLNGQQFDISGGSLSDDGQNLFHSFQELGLKPSEIANFLAQPQIRNILGRVVGGNASIIDGLIQVSNSNANLFLMNPAGIVFGPQASLNVPAAFTATTADGIGFAGGWFNATGPSNYASLVGDPNQFAFTASNPGSIINAGNLAVAEGQTLMLLGGTAINTGTLTAPGGNITLAAVPGENLVRISQANMLLSLEFVPISTAAVDPGNGTPAVVSPTALDLPQLLTVANLGHATGVVADADGALQLTGSTLALPTAPGTTIASGTLDTSNVLSPTTPTPHAPAQIGGEINILGDTVGVIDADINASGTDGGGHVRIGGGLKGAGTVPNAAVTFINSTSTINVSALTRGNGGEAIIWSNETSRIYGSIQARGGTKAGNGGFVETSSGGFLDVAHSPDISAPAGSAGTWLIDPFNITICDPCSSSNIFTTNPFNAIGDDAQLNVNDLLAALTGGANVMVSTGASSGNITLAATLDFDGTGTNTLTFLAEDDIFINAPIFDSSGGDSDRLHLVFEADFGDAGAGNANINALIDTAGGTATLQGRTIDLSGPATDFDNTTVTVIGKGNSATLVGPSQDTTWNVTGTNAGTLNSNSVLSSGLTFSNIQNLTGSDSNDSFILNGGSVGTINGGVGDNSLTGDNSINTWNITAANTGNLNGTTTFSNIQALIGGSADDNFDFGGGIQFNGTIAGGAGLNDTLDYSAFTSALSVDLAALGATDIETVRGTTAAASTLLGPDSNNIWDIAGTNGGSLNGSLNFIDFQHLNGGNANDNFTLNGGSVASIDGSTGDNSLAGDNMANTWNITAANAGDVNGVGAFSNIQNLNGGNANDSFVVNGGSIASVDGNVGDNSLTGDNIANTWNITAANAGDVNGVGAFSNIQTLNGGNLDDSFTLNGGSIVSIDGSTGDNSLTGDNMANTWNITAANAGDINGVNTFSNIQTLNGGNLDDSFTLNGGSVASIDGNVGDNSLAGDNMANTWNITAANAGDVNGIGVFSNIQTLIGGSANDSFIVNGGSVDSIDGNVGDNSLTGDNMANTWNITAADAGDVNGVGAFSNIQTLIGGNANDSFMVNGGSVASIDGNVGDNSLTGDNMANTWNITAADAGDVNGVGAFSNIQTLIGGNLDDSFSLNGGSVASIDGSSGHNSLTGDNIANTWNITAADAGDVNGVGAFSNIQTLIGGNLDDSFSLNGGSVASIDGSSGHNSLTGDDSANTWNITAANAGDVNGTTFSGIQSLIGGSSNDSFDFANGTHFNGTIAGGAGSDTLDYSAFTSTLIVNLVPLGATNIETVVGRAAGASTLIGHNSNNTWNITGTNSGTLNGSLTFIDFQGLIGGSLDDSFILNGGSVASINGSAGNNSLTGDNSANTWTIVDLNAGNIDGTVAFSNIQNLAGGNDSDTFRFSGSTAQINGNLDGVGITDTLDYSGYTGSDITVTLGTNVPGMATGVGGAIASIESIVGNEAFNNTLIGENVNSIWSVTDLDSGNIDETVSFTNIQNITGGDANDTFRFIGSSAQISGDLNGGGGINMLDYSLYTGEFARFDLDPEIPGTAPGIEGTFLSLEDIIFPPADRLIPSSVQETIKVSSQSLASLGVGIAGSFVEKAGAEESETFSSGELGQTSNQALEESRAILGNIGGETGVRPSLIYAFFTPSGLSGPEANGECNQQALTSTSETNTTAADFNCWIQEEDRLHLVLVTAEGDVVRVPVAATTRKQVLATADQLLARTTDPLDVKSRRYLKPARKMYQWLVAPLEEALQTRGIQNLVFILDRSLRSVPLAAMHDGEGFIIERYSVGLMPSLSLTDTRYVDAKQLQILAMGAEAFPGQDQEPLPAVAAEVAAISDQLWQGDALLNREFTLKNLQRSRKSQAFGILHLATHAEFQPGKPGNSYIQLWNEKLSFQQLREQLQLADSPVELMVLSACRTALGDEEAELGFAGLAVQAGVKSVLGSLWYVSDEGTLGLMTSFYEQLRTAPIKAEALRQAQLALLRGEVHFEADQLVTPGGKFPLPPKLTGSGNLRFTHPYYWSGFTIVGNPW